MFSDWVRSDRAKSLEMSYTLLIDLSFTVCRNERTVSVHPLQDPRDAEEDMTHMHCDFVQDSNVCDMVVLI